jgi:hypothetical protein
MVPGERWTCEACNKPLVAARTMSGLIVRIDRDPSEYGTVLLQPHDGVLTAITMGGPLLSPPIHHRKVRQLRPLRAPRASGST